VGVPGESVGLPLLAILATIPGPLTTILFPSQYGGVDVLLKYTAVTGLAAGGISLVTTLCQAANDYSCLKRLGTGLAGYVIGLLTQQPHFVTPSPAAPGGSRPNHSSAVRCSFPCSAGGGQSPRSRLCARPGTWPRQRITRDA
jgi:hypothetical protein